MCSANVVNTHTHAHTQALLLSDDSPMSELRGAYLVLDSDRERQHLVFVAPSVPEQTKLPHEGMCTHKDTHTHTQSNIQYVQIHSHVPLMHTNSDLLIIPLQRMLDFPSLPPSLSPLSHLGFPLHPTVSI